MMASTLLTQAEFQRRWQAMAAVAEKSGYDGLLFFSTECEPANVRYLSDYWPSFETAAVLVVPGREPVLIIGPESLNYATARSRIDRICQVMDLRESSQPDYPGSTLPTWEDVLREHGVRRLGIAGYPLVPYVIMKNIAAALGSFEAIGNADDLVRPVFIQKSAAEIACLKKAAQVSECGFKAVLEAIRPGMSEAELCGIATAAMLANGAEATGYPVWCCSGPNSAQAISRPTLRRIGTGEIVHFSIGAKVEGYSASIGRPVVLGQCPAGIRRFLQVGLDAANLTVELMRAGSRSGAVASQVHDYIRAQGYGHAILYGPAHGCGQMECEYPFLETSSQYVLEDGMVFMQDMFLTENQMGFRWEDGVIVRPGGGELLSSYGRQITIL